MSDESVEPCINKDYLLTSTTRGFLSLEEQ